MKLLKSKKFYGVYFNQKNKKWVTIINNNMVIGEYLFEEAAARAYDKAAIRYFGRKAQLNFKETIDKF